MNGMMIRTKQDRHDALRRLMANGAVSTQDQLRRALKRDGFRVDQSTLSRDLAELGYRKAGGRYAAVEAPPPAAKLDLAPAVRSFLACGPHLVIIHTEMGQAQAVAVAIDQNHEAAIVATLAGDDAIFVAVRNRRTQAVVLRRLAEWFGDKQER